MKRALFLAALLPLGRLVAAGLADWRGWFDDVPESRLGELLTLGVNPIEFVTRSTGTWTLVALLATLAVTPLRRLTGWSELARVRRMLGLFAFFYAVLHFTTYIWVDQFFDLRAIVADIWKRPFITVGFSAFLLLLPLAATSTNAMARRLGVRRWRALHQCVYAIATLGVLHFWWLVKRDLTEPIAYASVLALLLGVRLWWRSRSLAHRRAT